MKFKCILMLIIFMFVLLALIQINKPFHGDEVVFPECAKGIIKQGVPIINYGILNPDYQCLWHAPLFMYILALSSLIFGDNYFAYRIVSVLFVISSIILIYFLTKKIFEKDNNKDIYAIIAAILYAFNPLTIQSALITDIDGGILTFFTILFVYLYVKNSKIVWLISSLILLFLTKVSGPIIVFASLILFFIYKKSIKGILKTILLFIVSAAIFILIFWIYCYSFNLDFLMPFRHNFIYGGGLLSNHFNLINISKMAWVFKNMFYFIIPSFFLLFITSLIFLLYNNLKRDKNIKPEYHNLIILFSIISLLTIGLFTYTGAGGFGFPKYFAPAIPFMAIVISSIIFPSIIKNFAYVKWFILKNKWRIFMLLCFLMIYFIFFVGDPLMPEFDSTAKNADILLAIKLIARSFFLYIIIPFIATFSILRGNKKVVFGLIFMTFFFYLYINVLQASVSYSTSFRYGDTGIEDVLAFIKEKNISPNQIATYPNIGYYLEMSDYYEIMMLYLDSATFKKSIIDNADIKYIIIYERDIDRIGMENMDYFELDKQIGTYFIFKKK